MKRYSLKEILKTLKKADKKLNSEYEKSIHPLDYTEGVNDTISYIHREFLKKEK